MHSLYDGNSDIDDISVNTNLKVFNGGLGLNKNLKKETFYKKDKNKISNYSKEFHDLIEKKNKENLLYNIFSKEIKLDKDSLIETEGIISFRSKIDNDRQCDFNNITNGIINKIDNLNKNKKESRNLINNTINSNNNEEHTINKVFKLNEEKETEKVIKNFEKESQRIQSRILEGNRLKSTSSDFSDDDNKLEKYTTDKIKKTLDGINKKNFDKTSKIKNNIISNGFEKNRSPDIYKKNYNFVASDERINFYNSPYEDVNIQNEGLDINEKNIFWNLRGNDDNTVNSKYNKMDFKRSKSLIDNEYHTGNNIF